MQMGLFGPVSGVAMVAPGPEVRAAGRRPGMRLGTSSWSFPGWPVWAGRYTEERIAKEGLGAYASHPCISTVGVDRSFYKPLTEAQWRQYVGQVPSDFSFLVKAPEESTVAVWPTHARYGARGGTANARYLDAAWVDEAAVGPMMAGLGGQLGVLLFQFPPQAVEAGFLGRLEAFLARVVRPGLRVAVEVRNARLATPDFGRAVRAGGAVPCLNVWGGMPHISELRRAWGSDPVAVVRWMIPPGGEYGALEAAFAPFDRIRAPDDAMVEAVLDAMAGASESWVIVDNKAEGCAIRSVERLAVAAARRR